MPTLGSLLRKKRTRDKDSDSKESAQADSPTAQTSSSTLSKGTTDTKDLSSRPAAALTPAAPVDESNKNLEQAPTAPHPVDANAEQQHVLEQAAAPPGNMDGTGQAVQPPMAQGKPPANGQQAGVHPMADGTWPITRDSKATKGKYTLPDFEFRRTLGTGSFGRVHLVKSKHNQRFYAIKVLKKAQVVRMKQVEHTNDERRMLAKVKHPFLITLWGTFNDSKNLYMVMDFVEGGELFSLLRKSQVSLLWCGGLTLLHNSHAHSASRTRSPNSTRPKWHWHWIICTRSTSSTAI